MRARWGGYRGRVRLPSEARRTGDRAFGEYGRRRRRSRSVLPRACRGNAHVTRFLVVVGGSARGDVVQGEPYSVSHIFLVEAASDGVRRAVGCRAFHLVPNVHRSG